MIHDMDKFKDLSHPSLFPQLRLHSQNQVEALATFRATDLLPPNSWYNCLYTFFRSFKTLSLDNFVVKSVKYLKWSLFAGATCAALYVAYRIYSGYNKTPYRKFNSNDVPSLEHRPLEFIGPDPAVGFPLDSRGFDPTVAPEADDELESLAHINLSASKLMDRLCKECKSINRHCKCNNGKSSYVDALTALHLQSVSKKRSLQKLYAPKHLQTFSVGDIISYPYFRYPSLNLSYQVADSFVCADTRPSNESHIRLSNTRMYVMRLVGLVHPSYGILPEFVLRMDGHLMRDLVVSEDIMRNTRRGVLTCKHPLSLIGNIDNGLSIPLNDPAVLKFGASIPKDSFYFTLALTEHKFGPLTLN